MVERSHQNLLKETKDEFRKLKVLLEARDLKNDALRRSEAEEWDGMEIIEYKRGNDVAAGDLLENYGKSSILLLDPTEEGWRVRSDMAIEVFF